METIAHGLNDFQIETNKTKKNVTPTNKHLNNGSKPTKNW